MEIVSLLVGLFVGFLLGAIYVMKEVFVDSTKEEIIEFFDEIQELEEYHEQG